MNCTELMNKVADILEDFPAGVLATTDVEDRPHMRWMVPALLPGNRKQVYAVSTVRFKEALENYYKPNVEWMVYSRHQGVVINLRGIIRVIDLPSIKMEVMEVIGKKLQTFWVSHLDQSEFVVLETEVTEGIYDCPGEGRRLTVSF